MNGHKFERGMTQVVVILAIVICLGLFIGGYFISVTRNQKPKDTSRDMKSEGLPRSSQIGAILNPTIPPNASSDPLVTWQKYQGKGFTIKYPSTWEIESHDDIAIPNITYLGLYAQGKAQSLYGPELAIYVYKDKAALPDNQEKQLSFQDWLQKEAQDNRFINQKAITYAKVPAYEGILIGEISIFGIFLEHKGLIYEIMTNTEVPTSVQKQILLSFTLE